LKTPAILLASGLSQRMGGENKLLKHWRGKPLALWALEVLTESDVGQVIVVTHRDAAEIAALLAEPTQRIRFVENPDARRGLSTSLLLGLMETQTSVGLAAGVLVHLADMPLVSPETINRVIGAAKAPAYAVIPRRRQDLGNPVWLSGAAAMDCQRLAGDKGARSLIAPHPQTCFVDMDNDEILFDVDTPEDFS
jgi:molybdenum cofactor cytidylyltransferase